jgi:methionyl aminopeptidase
MPNIKSKEEIAIMREAGRKLGRVLARLEKIVRPGVTGLALDSAATDYIREEHAKPAFLNYKPNGASKAYPATLCFSVNDVVVHGVPSEYKVADGDLIKLDLGLVHEGFYADAAITVPVGNVSKKARELVEVTRQALERAVAMAKPGNTLGDIGHAIESFVVRHGFSVVDALTGHGIGRKLHEDPWVMNRGVPGKGEPLIAGMVIAIEPMIAIGKPAVRQLKSDESYATKDGSLSAHFEHTVAITENGAEILTVVQ